MSNHANTNYSNSLVKIMMVGSYKLSFFVCVIRGPNRTLVRRGRRKPFASYNAAGIGKDEQQKRRVNISGRVVRAVPLLTTKPPVNSWFRWAKRVQPAHLGRRVFTAFVRRAAIIKGAKTLLAKITETPRYNIPFRLLFLRLFLIDNSDAG